MKILTQWINWKLFPVEGQLKPAKVPYCYKTNRKINAHDSANWLPFEEAKALCEYVGFVLTPNDPYFCIDLDDCFENGQWSQFSQNVLSWFPDAYVEISHSQDGFHIFGRYDGVLSEHKNKLKIGESSLELYSNGRFIAYTEYNFQGDYNTNFTENLNKFINQYMVPDNNQNSGPVPVRSSEKYGGYLKPDPEWIGPEDDAELIQKMFKSQSTHGFLELKATFKNLWKNDVAVLTKFYPDPAGKNPYDRSAADMALAYHLAFWTGRDGPRIERLMRKSALMREKWNKHKEYLSGSNYTIHNACLNCKKIYKNPKLIEEKIVKASGDHNYLIVSQLLTISKQVEYFKGCVYILDRNCIFTPQQGVLKQEQFNAWYGGKTFAITTDGKITSKKPYDAFTMSQGYNFPKVSGSCFRPELEPGKLVNIDGKEHVNTYIPAKIILGKGPIDLFLFQVKALFPEKEDYDKFMNWAASANQNIGVKFRWCIVLQGVPGNGKSLLMKCIAHGIGEKFVFYPQANDLGNKFNSFMDEKLMIIVDEVDMFNKLEITNAMKPLIANDRIAIQAKGVDAIMTDNRANFMMATNHKNAISKTKDDRRYAVFYTPQQKKEDLIRDGLTENFYKKFTHWLYHKNGLNDVAGYLKRFKIDDALDPATSLLRAPQTTSTQEAIRTSETIVHQEIKEAIDEGSYGFRGGWVSSFCLTKRLQEKNMGRYLPRSKYKALLSDLGYITAPWFTKGRTTIKMVNEDNTQPVLYIKESFKYGNPLTTNDYINAQAGETGLPVFTTSGPVPPPPPTLMKG